MAIWLKYVAESNRELAKSQDWQHDSLRHIKEAEKKKRYMCVEFYPKQKFSLKWKDSQGFPETPTVL